jgi:preprotein translocase subunit SecB
MCANFGQCRHALTNSSPGAAVVLAQYTKDLSYENPNAPGSLGPQPQPPQINI